MENFQKGLGDFMASYINGKKAIMENLNTAIKADKEINNQQSLSNLLDEEMDRMMVTLEEMVQKMVSIDKMYEELG